MSITSDEVNYLVYRYLQESGFEHSAFLFGYESMIMNKKEFHSNLKPGALVIYLQKALQFMEMEAHIKADGTEIECVAPFSLITPHVCMQKWKETNQEADEMAVENKDISTYKEIKKDDCLVLADHKDQVTVCTWNPKDSSLATGSLDDTVCLYNINEKSINNIPVVCQQSSNTKNNDITCASWNSEGNCLVSGASEGTVCLWNKEGKLLSSVNPFKNHVFSARFSPNNQELLVCGLDPSIYLYDIKDPSNPVVEMNSLKLNENNTTGVSLPSLAILLDCDWMNNNTYSFSYNDGEIFTVNRNSDNHTNSIVKYDGHNGEVNVLRWSSQYQRLASAGEDKYVKIWSPTSSSSLCEYNNNTSSLYSLQWNDQFLYTGSLDGTINVYDTEANTCVKQYTYHKKPVYALAVSNNKHYLASASADHYIYVYNTLTHERIRTFICDGVPFSIDFNNTNDKLAIGSSDGKTYIMDLRV